MKAIKLYDQLERDFITKEMSDDWSPYIAGTEKYLTENFKERSMGLVCDFTEEINRVYSAVFPSEKVMREILDKGAADAMLFVHHPAAWDISREIALYPMDTGLLERFREHRISIYNLHVPLDNYGEYGTSKTLADALGLEIEKPFAPCFGALCGVIGKTRCKTVEELQEVFSRAVGHKTALYPYGAQEIKGGRVAVAAGGGNDRGVVAEMIEKRCPCPDHWRFGHKSYIQRYPCVRTGAGGQRTGRHPLLHREIRLYQDVRVFRRAGASGSLYQ